MSRNLKALGLALIAVVALSAFASPAAQANNVTASAYTTTLTGTDVNTVHEKLARLTIGNGKRWVECTGATLSSTLTKATTANTVTPAYSGCFSNSLTAVTATVTVNTCDFSLEATSKTAGRATIKCSKEGDQIEVHIYTDETEKTLLCTYDIKPQGPLTGATLKVANEGTATEDLLVNLNALQKVKILSTIGSANACGVNATEKPVETEGSLTGEYTVTGVSAGAHTRVMVE